MRLPEQTEINAVGALYDEQTKILEEVYAALKELLEALGEYSKGKTLGPALCEEINPPQSVGFESWR